LTGQSGGQLSNDELLAHLIQDCDIEEVTNRRLPDQWQINNTTSPVTSVEKFKHIKPQVKEPLGK